MHSHVQLSGEGFRGSGRKSEEVFKALKLSETALAISIAPLGADLETFTTSLFGWRGAGA